MPPSKLRTDLERVQSASPAKTPGIRMTKQRRVVYDVLMDQKDHPTATEVFLRSKERMSAISLATVYNCLETLTDAGLVKQVNVDREPSRFCPNLHDHAHFFCSNCGQVQDVAPAEPSSTLSSWDIPSGTKVELVEVAMRGVCSSCAAASQES
tara:strand:- start:1677 stop:2135 length:459 start_codon:yes stop_codon:yes gene_type:complete